MTDGTTSHPLFTALRPLLAVVGGEVVPVDHIEPADIPIEWNGEVIGGIRLGSLSGELDRIVAHIESELGASLSSLDRVQKQAAVRMLDERGAFLLRRAIEDVAEMMGVSRITIYNYLNAIRND